MAKAVVPSSIVFEVLEKDNYVDWSETIRAYLEFKDLWDVVESNEQPPDRDADEAKFRAWNKKNSEALHAIKISCGRHFLSKIRGTREANKAWRTLQENFKPPLPRRLKPTINAQPVLEGHNYVDWSEAIEAYLKDQDLWDVVISDQQPPKIEQDEAQFKAWEKKNAAALQAIKISCGTNTLPCIRGIDEANIAWRRLKIWFANPRLFSNAQNFFRVKAIERSRADEENVDNEYKKANEDLVDALSKSNLSAARELCKNYPLLLTERLPNHGLVLNELIKLVGCDHQEDVVEILRSVPFDESQNYTYQDTGFFDRTPLEVAVRVGAVEIAKCLVQMDSRLLYFSDTLGLTPLAAAIGSHNNEMAKILFQLTEEDTSGSYDSSTIYTLITKCFEVENLDFALKLLNSNPEGFILTKDSNGRSPLYAAASAPHLFRRIYHHRFLPKHICKVLGPRLPLGSINFNISGMEFLIHLGKEIRNLTHSEEKIDIVCDAFFEAIKRGNFYFILMLINSITCIEHLTNNKSRNMYMVAIAHRRAKIFSLWFWKKKDETMVDASLIRDKWGNNVLHMVGASRPPIALDQISKPAQQMKRELMWFKEIENLVPDLVGKSRNHDGKTPHELFNESHKDLMVEAGKWMKESASSWAIVGPLIITIMFAASFQLPGGSLQDKGYPVFLGKWLFKVYMVLVAISLFSATISVLKFLEILSANYEEEDFLASWKTYNVITGTLFLSLATMLVAFCLGLFLTVHGELAIFLPITGIATFLVGFILCTKLHLLAESLTFFTFEKGKIPFNKWRTSIFDTNIDHEVGLIFKMLNPDNQQRR